MSSPHFLEGNLQGQPHLLIALLCILVLGGRRSFLLAQPLHLGQQPLGLTLGGGASGQV